MKWLLVALTLLFPAVVLAAPASELPHGPRIELDAAGDSVLVQYDHVPVRIDTLGVSSGFSPGGTNDALSIFESGRAQARGLAQNEYLEVRGTASKLPENWIGERVKRRHALDTEAGFSRGKAFADSVNAVYPGSVRFNPEPILGEPYRGTVVTTYRVRRTVVAHIHTAYRPAPPDTVYVLREAESTKFGLGMEFSVVTFTARGLTRTTPKAVLVIQKPSVRLDLGIGWWPGDQHDLGRLDNGYGEIVVSYFPRGEWLGFNAGWVASSQFVREVTEYLQLDHGPAFGLTARFDRTVTGAFRVSYARVRSDQLNRPAEWANGFTVSAQLGKVF